MAISRSRSRGIAPIRSPSSHWQPLHSANSCTVPLDRRLQAQIIQDRRPQLDEIRRTRTDRPIDQRPHRRDPPGPQPRWQLLGQPRDVDVESGQGLTELVVELARDRRPFLLADRQQPRGEVPGPLVGDLDQLLIAPQLGHVAMDGNQADGTAIGIEEGSKGDVGPEGRAVPPARHHPARPRAGANRFLADPVQLVGRVGGLGKGQGRERLAQHLLGAVAEQAFGPLCPEGDAAAGVGGDDRFEHAVEQLRLEAQCVLRRCVAR